MPIPSLCHFRPRWRFCPPKNRKSASQQPPSYRNKKSHGAIINFGNREPNKTQTHKKTRYRRYHDTRIEQRYSSKSHTDALTQVSEPSGTVVQIDSTQEDIAKYLEDLQWTRAANYCYFFYLICNLFSYKINIFFIVLCCRWLGL